MKKAANRRRQLLALALSAVIMLTDTQLTALAAPIEESETEALIEETETETEASATEAPIEETRMETEVRLEETIENENTPSADTENEMSEEPVSETEKDVPTEAVLETVEEEIGSAVEEENKTEPESIVEEEDKTEPESIAEEEGRTEPESIAKEEGSTEPESIAEENEQTEEQTEPTASETESASDFVIENGTLRQYTGTDADIVIPEGVVFIGFNAFIDKPIETVVFSSTVKIIYGNAFARCKNLKSVTFNEGLEMIGDDAFFYCESLCSVDFPSSLEIIGKGAFRECFGLKSVALNEGLKKIHRIAFYDVPFGEKSETTGAVKLGTLTIPSTVELIEGYAFGCCKYLGKVIFANGETERLSLISSNYEPVFGGCSELTMVILPERLTQIMEDMITNDPKLEILYIPESVTMLGGVIYKCPNVTIYGVPGSKAEDFAKSRKLPFKNKDELDMGSEVKSVKLTPEVIEEGGAEAIGKQIQLYVEVLPDTAQNKKVAYRSDNENVAAVDKDGCVTIKGYGKAVITVTTEDGGKTAECAVSVSEEENTEDDNEEKPLISSVLFPKKQNEYSEVYTGEQIRPTMLAAYEYKDDNGKARTQPLKLNVDYTVRYKNNINAGENTAEVTITGIGGYRGVITKKFTIRPKSISGVMLSPVGDIVYGEKPSVVVTDGAYELSEGRDYSVKLSTTGAAGADTPSVLTVKGIGNYTGDSKKSVKFNILRSGTDIRSIAAEAIRVEFKKLPSNGYAYSGKAQKPGVVVTDTATGTKLSASEYKVLYTNNINAGTGTVRVAGVSKNGKGYYGISKPLSFDIKQKDFAKVSAALSGTIPKAGRIETIYKVIAEAVTVKDAKHVLSKDEYTIDYGAVKTVDDIKIGTKYPITLIARAGGNYIENTKKVIYIKFGQLNLASKTAKLSVQITDASKNELAFRYNGVLLVKDKDYTAVLKKDKNRDTYTVTIKAVKNSAYKGSRTIKKVQAGQRF